MCIRDSPIDRFDIVVAHEEDGNKDIVKRVIGMPGDTIRYENDKLYINDKETDEPYLAAVSYTHLRAHETVLDLVCRLLLEKKKKRLQ
ncbi:signal peptidase I [Streptococcus pneumoniae D39]|nr:signal peptidase I [Streptococcus pneumoniae D39]